MANLLDESHIQFNGWSALLPLGATAREVVDDTSGTWRLILSLPGFRIYARDAA